MIDVLNPVIKFMGFKTKFIQFAIKRLYWFARFWYNLSMFLTRKPRIKLPAYISIDEIAEVMDEVAHKWRPDPIKGVLDVCMHPTKFQRKLTQDVQELGDCDDYAAYWAACLAKNGLARNVHLASVFFDDGKKVGGHAVCVFQVYGDEAWYWADYGEPNKIGSFWDYAQEVAEAYGGEKVVAFAFEVKYQKKTSTPKLGKGKVKAF